MEKRPAIGPQLPPHLLPAEDETEEIGPVMNAPRNQTQCRVIDRIPTPEPQSRREEWMLVPPSSKLTIDPLKLRNRSFKQGRSGTNAIVETTGQSMWTETPHQRAKRILSGDEPTQPKKALKRSSPSPDPQPKQKSLFDMHQERLAHKKQEARRFDRDKDLVVLSGKRRLEAISQYGSLTSKFSRGGK
jgi:hypothetical protein